MVNYLFGWRPVEQRRNEWGRKLKGKKG